jgi:multiple sugar transport system permease protein
MLFPQRERRFWRGRSRRFWRDTIDGYLFTLPLILGLLLWTVGPMVASFFISFTHYPMLQTPTFTGLANYRDIFTAPYLRVLHSLWVTLLYTLLSLPLTLTASLGAALLLNQRIRGINLFRTAFYVPTIVPQIAMVFVWGWLLHPDFGLANAALRLLGLPRVNWLNDPDTALISLALLSLWSIGPTMIIFLAGLQTIPGEYYDAAKIDGAGGWQLFSYITLPMLSATTFFNVVMNVIAAFRYFVPPFVLTQGGPLYATYVYNLNLYEKAFQWLQMGLASAMAWLLFVIVLVITLLLFRSSDAWVHYEVQQ